MGETDLTHRLSGSQPTAPETEAASGEVSGQAGLSPDPFSPADRGSPDSSFKSSLKSSFNSEEFENRVAGHKSQLNYQPLVMVLICVAVGIFIDRTFDIKFGWSLGIGFFCFTIHLAVRGMSRQRSYGWRDVWAAVSLMMAFVCVGSGWHHGRWNWFGQHEIGLFATSVPAPICIEGRIASEPRLMAREQESEMNPIPRGDRTRFLFYPTRVRTLGAWKPVSGRLDLVVHQNATQFRSGDYVQVVGQLVKIEPPSNPGQVDFSSLYRAERKLAVLHTYFNESLQLKSRSSWRPTTWISGLRRQLNEMIWEHVDGERAGLASAILLGNREQLTHDRRELFLETGTVHLLAISGLHVGILAGVFFTCFRLGLMGRRQFLISTILFVLFYSWLVEFRPPVTRASILIILYCCGRLCGRRSLSFHWLSLAGLIVLAMNPSDLFGLGPQLSFLAVTTLVFGKDWIFWQPSNDPIDRLIRNSRPWHVRTFYWVGRKLRAAMLVSGLIWLVGMPLVAYKFHLLAPIALVINPFLLIPIAFALYCGMGVLVIGWVFPPLASLLGKLCDWNLGWVETMIGGAQSIPGGHVWTAGPMFWSIIVFYLGLFFIAIYPPTRRSWPTCLVSVAVWFVFGWMLPDAVRQLSVSRSKEVLNCTFVDLGHGTCVILELPDGKTIMCDAGTMRSENYGASTIASVLWSRRIRKIDALFISHGDVDHFNAVPDLLDRFEIGCVYVAPVMANHRSPAVQLLFRTIRERGVPVKFAFAPGEMHVGAIDIEILSPPEAGTDDFDNSNSLALLIRFAGRQLLICGDLERSGMDYLLTQTSPGCDIALAPHHGSKNSRPEDFGVWAAPEYIVVSASEKRVDDNVIRIWESQGIIVLRTDRDGAIRFSLDAEGIHVGSWKQDRDWPKSRASHKTVKVDSDAT